MDASGIGRVNSFERVRMEYIPVLALVVSVVKIAFMWLNYRDCRKTKDTDCD